MQTHIDFPFFIFMALYHSALNLKVFLFELIMYLEDHFTVIESFHTPFYKLNNPV
jgi:hypothetical protein